MSLIARAILFKELSKLLQENHELLTVLKILS